MKKNILLLLATSFVFTSCKNEVASNKNTTTRVIPFTEVGNQMRNEATAKAVVPNNSTSSNPSVGATAKGMNPPHGEAGHRCDIAVGAPLNSPATPTKPTAKGAAGPSMNVSPVTTASTNTAVTPTPEGMNPPHGQAGHRCDIAVGAELPKE